MILICTKPYKYCSKNELLEIIANPNMNSIYGSMASIELNYMMEEYGYELFKEKNKEGTMFVDISTLSEEEMKEWNKKRGYDEK